MQKVYHNQEMWAQVVQGPEAIKAFAKDWDDLFERSTNAPPYLSRTWVDTFINEGRLRGTPLYVLVWADNKLVGLFPLAVHKFLNLKIAKPIGTGQPTYLGLLLDPDYPSAVEHITQLIASKNIFEVYYSLDLSSEDMATNDLLASLRQKGYFCRQVPRFRNPCHYIQLGCSFDEYLRNNKSPKSRQTIRRKERKLCEHNNVTKEYYSGIEVTTQILRRIALIQQESWMKRRGAAVLGQPFYQKLLMEMAKAGFGRVWLLTINGEDIAFVYALVAHKKLYYAWTGFKLKYATSLSVGLVLTMWTIRKACEDGILSFNFGHGDSEYKRFWANKFHRVNRVIVAQGFEGRVIAIWYFVVWRLATIRWLRSLYRRVKRVMFSFRNDVSSYTSFRLTKRLGRIDEVALWRLCIGCGACMPACTENAISLVDVLNRGIRPKVDPTKCKECGECILVCPGVGISHQPFNNQSIAELRKSWGPVLEVWEGYATDPEIRFRGSSGGVSTALALFCLEKKRASGVLHICANPENPLQNTAVFSKSKEGLLTCTGSRYSPAAPCEKFKLIQAAPSPSVFIGKPCDIVALRKSQVVDPALSKKVSLAISIFCAGTPATKGTLEVLSTLSVTPEKVQKLRYRGNGWPGMTTVKLKGTDGEQREMTYEESWGNILSNYCPLRCRLCPDGTGEFADVSCGDPWYRKIEPDDPGRSLVLVRTERGRDLLHKAMESGYVHLNKVQPELLPHSQQSLLNKRRNLWGRLLVMRMIRIPAPHYVGFSLFANWWRLSMTGQIHSVLGTLYRIILRKLNKPSKYYSE
jgi:coenzyme F420 hydrogenase subunit beta